MTIDELIFLNAIALNNGTFDPSCEWEFRERFGDVCFIKMISAGWIKSAGHVFKMLPGGYQAIVDFCDTKKKTLDKLLFFLDLTSHVEYMRREAAKGGG